MTKKMQHVSKPSNFQLMRMSTETAKRSHRLQIPPLCQRLSSHMQRQTRAAEQALQAARVSLVAAGSHRQRGERSSRIRNLHGPTHAGRLSGVLCRLCSLLPVFLSLLWFLVILGNPQAGIRRDPVISRQASSRHASRALDDAATPLRVPVPPLPRAWTPLPRRRGCGGPLSLPTLPRASRKHEPELNGMGPAGVAWSGEPGEPPQRRSGFRPAPPGHQLRMHVQRAWHHRRRSPRAGKLGGNDGAEREGS